MADLEYTVVGLASNESLSQNPTLAYASTPDTSKLGSVVINISEATVPTGGNYNETITYETGTLTISKKPVGKIPVTISGVSAPSTMMKYTGNAIENSIFGTPSFAPAWSGTPEYTYYEVGGATEIALSSAPKNVGSYKVKIAIPDKDKSYKGETTILFTIYKADVSITAKNKDAYVGDAAPALLASDYTVLGLANGESLKTVPTLAYASIPNMSWKGTVTINASGVAVPSGRKYNETITYQSGTLTIKEKSSSGSSSSSGGSGGKSGSFASATPSKPMSGSSDTTVIVDSAGNATATVTEKNIADAVKAAHDAAKKQGVRAGEITAIINVTTGAENANKVSLNLPLDVQNQVIDGKIDNVAIVIDKPDIAISMNLATITEMHTQANEDIQLSATRTDASTLSEEAKSCYRQSSNI